MYTIVLTGQGFKAFAGVYGSSQEFNEMPFEGRFAAHLRVTDN